MNENIDRIIQLAEQYKHPDDFTKAIRKLLNQHAKKVNEIFDIAILDV